VPAHSVRAPKAPKPPPPHRPLETPAASLDPLIYDDKTTISHDVAKSLGNC